MSIVAPPVVRAKSNLVPRILLVLLGGVFVCAFVIALDQTPTRPASLEQHLDREFPTPPFGTSLSYRAKGLPVAETAAAMMQNYDVDISQIKGGHKHSQAKDGQLCETNAKGRGRTKITIFSRKGQCVLVKQEALGDLSILVHELNFLGRVMDMAPIP